MNNKNTMRLLWEPAEEGGLRLLRVYGEIPELVLPETLEQKPITEIGPYCFSKSERLSGKMLHTTEIGEENGKEKVLHTITGSDLVKVCLPDSVRLIGNGAFYNCRNLVSLEVGPFTKEIGSDVFTNCNSLKELHIRCQNGQTKSAKPLLSRISTELEVYYYETEENRKRLFSVLLYPEYVEIYDEIAPAHIFGKQIQGEGFRARQCFREDKILFEDYDKIFQKAKAEETPLTVGRMCMFRLLYSVGLTKQNQMLYEAFLKENEERMGMYFVKAKNRNALEYCFQKKLFSVSVADSLISYAAELGWSEGTSGLLHWKHKWYQDIGKSSYQFEVL